MDAEEAALVAMGEQAATAPPGKAAPAAAAPAAAEAEDHDMDVDMEEDEEEQEEAPIRVVKNYKRPVSVGAGASWRECGMLFSWHSCGCV